jgi:hypothetical protein
MAEFALGWLYWSEEQTLHSDINAILVAMRGHMNMLRALHGKADENPPPWLVKQQKAAQAKRIAEGATVAPEPKARMMTPDAFDAMFGGKHTRRVAKINR